MCPQSDIALCALFNEGTNSGVLCSPDGFGIGPLNSQHARDMLPATQCCVVQGDI